MSDFEAMAGVVRSIRLESEIACRGIKLAPGVAERCGPCPVCGGMDRFSINLKKQVWNCRGCARGGDVIALVQHIDGGSFMEAVETLAGHAPRFAAKRNLRTGRWSDFATGDKGGDLVSLVAYLEGCSQPDAARLLGRMLGAGNGRAPDEPAAR
jgi:hypothetical protein